MPSSDRRVTRPSLLYVACLAALVLGGSGPMAIDGYQEEEIAAFKSQQDGIDERCSSRRLSRETCHKADEIASVVQLLVIDRPISCRVRGSFNAEDRATLLHA